MSGDRTLYHVPGEAARLMVGAGIVTARPTGGRVREVDITYPASAYAERTGEPSPPSYGVRFHRWRRLDNSATRIIEHHPRALYVL